MRLASNGAAASAQIRNHRRDHESSRPSDSHAGRRTRQADLQLRQLRGVCYHLAMSVPDSPDLEAIARAAREAPGLDVLFLFGSRARGEAGPHSDWDFGYLASQNIDEISLLATIAAAVGSDRVDLVDLARAGGLLRYRAARDGRIVFESRPDLADRFRLDAASFWCDAEPILRGGYERVLRELSR